MSWSEHPCPLVCRRSTTSAATPGRSRRAHAPLRSSKASRCRCRRSRTSSCAPRSSAGSRASPNRSPACSRFASRSPRETVGGDPGQLINMLFGNTSLHDDVTLHDVALPAELVKGFGGPRHGLHELRRRVGAPARALTCSALKPQGSAPRRARGSRAAFRTRRRRLHQGRPWPGRPGLFAIPRARRRRCGRRCGLVDAGRQERCAMCRASRAISTPCASRSPTPAAPASIPS